MSTPDHIIDGWKLIFRRAGEGSTRDILAIIVVAAVIGFLGWFFCFAARQVD